MRADLYVIEEWGVGSGEWGVGSGEWGVGSEEWGVGSGEWGVGSGEWGAGEWGAGVGSGRSFTIANLKSGKIKFVQLEADFLSFGIIR